MQTSPADDKATFLAEFRTLRDRACIDHDELAARTHFPTEVLRSAESGPGLPGLPVLAAYVRACGGDLVEWEERWRRLGGAGGDDTGLPTRPAGASAAARAGARAGVSVVPADVHDPDRIRKALRAHREREDKPAGQSGRAGSGAGSGSAGPGWLADPGPDGQRDGWGLGTLLADGVSAAGGGSGGTGDGSGSAGGIGGWPSAGLGQHGSNGADALRAPGSERAAAPDPPTTVSIKWNTDSSGNAAVSSAHVMRRGESSQGPALGSGASDTVTSAGAATKAQSGPGSSGQSARQQVSALGSAATANASRSRQIRLMALAVIAVIIVCITALLLT